MTTTLAPTNTTDVAVSAGMTFDQWIAAADTIYDLWTSTKGLPAESIAAWHPLLADLDAAVVAAAIAGLARVDRWPPRSAARIREAADYVRHGIEPLPETATDSCRAHAIDQMLAGGF